MCFTLFFLGEPPLQVFFPLFLALVLFGFEGGSKPFPQFDELLIGKGKPAALAHIAFRTDHILKFSAALWAITHFTSAFSSTYPAKRDGRSLGNTFWFRISY